LRRAAFYRGVNKMRVALEMQTGHSVRK
jgi:hypothetical protein